MDMWLGYGKLGMRNNVGEEFLVNVYLYTDGMGGKGTAYNRP
jgi:hypothetical protein